MITASTVNVKTMADDTLRLVIDIEPRHAQEAFALFGVRGRPVVIARLTNEVAQKAIAAEAEPKPKGGLIAKWLGMRCAEPEFREWLISEFGCAFPVLTEQEAAELVRRLCHVKSRAELDNNAEAATWFHEHIRVPYAEYVRGAA